MAVAINLAELFFEFSMDNFSNIIPNGWQIKQETNYQTEQTQNCYSYKTDEQGRKVNELPFRIYAVMNFSECPGTVLSETAADEQGAEQRSDGVVTNCHETARIGGKQEEQKGIGKKNEPEHKKVCYKIQKSGRAESLHENNDNIVHAESCLMIRCKSPMVKKSV